MNIDDLASVEYEDEEGFNRFAFENAQQHQLFKDVLTTDAGIVIPSFPLYDPDPTDIDNWLLAHYQEHQAIASALNLDISINLLDTDWRKEDDFYDWLNLHYLSHEQIIKTLGLT